MENGMDQQEKKDLALEFTIRRKIYNHILKSPGLYERELARELDIPLSTLDYHLYYLKKRDLIKTSSDGRYTRYYISETLDSREKGILSILRQRVPRKIMVFLLLHADSTHKDICNELRLAPSTISFHLKKLEKVDALVTVQSGRNTLYYIKDPEFISDLLIIYRKSFLDDAVSQFVDTWLEVHPRHLRKKKDKD